MEKIKLITNQNDISNTTKIINKAILKIAEKFNYTIQNCPIFPAFINETKINKEIKKNTKLFGYFVNEKLIGTAGYRSTDDKEVFQLRRLAVNPDNQNKGIGSKLVNYICNQLKTLKCNIIEAEFAEENSSLVEWYLNLNFEVFKTYELPELPFKVLVMRKEII